MTALRVITEHSELSGSGVITHSALDAFVSGTMFLVVSGSIPPGGRRIVQGSNVTIIDGGPGGDLIISATGGSGGGTPISWNERPVGNRDNVNMTFTLQYSPNPPSALMFFVNGIKLSHYPDDMTVPSRDYDLFGNVVTLLVDYVSGSNIEATYPY